MRRELRSEKPYRLAVRSKFAGRPHSPSRRRRFRAACLFRLHNLVQIVEEPRIDARQLVHLRDAHAALERVAQVPHPLGARLRELRDDLLLARLLGRCPTGRAGRSRSRRCRTSSPRSAFWNDSLNVLPMAIVSPTLFICVVSVASASGNFSNANRGTFVTT